MSPQFYQINSNISLQRDQATSRIGGGRFSGVNVYNARLLGPFASKNELVYSLLTLVHLTGPYFQVTLTKE